MSRVEVWYEGRCHGTAKPFALKRHSHPKLLKPPAIPAAPPDTATTETEQPPSCLAELQARYERVHFGHIDYSPATRNQEDRP